MTVRGVAGAVVLGLMALSAAYGDNLAGVRDRVPPPATRVWAPVSSSEAGSERRVRRSHPWWRTVATHAGGGDARTAPFSIGEEALQWRVRWRCTGGRLSLRAVRPATGRAFGHPLANGERCPGRGSGLAVSTGRLALQLSGARGWRVAIEEQVDLPRHEPALPDITADRLLAAGALRNLERTGEGRVTVHRLSDGRAVLRLADFYVTPNVDLELRLSTLSRPGSSREVLDAPSTRIAALDATTGSRNVVLPRGLDRRWRSVVVWCPPLRQAYAFAPLRRR